MPISNKSWVVRVYLPFILLVGYAFLMFFHRSDGRTASAAVCMLPLLIAGLWLLFVPADLRITRTEQEVEIIRWRSQSRVRMEDIDQVKRGFSVFGIIITRSGQRVLYVAENENKQLRERLKESN